MTASFIVDHGEALAVRYLDYSAIEQWYDADKYQAMAARLSHTPLEQSEMDRYAKRRETMLSKHGKEFDRPTGWAYGYLPSGMRLSFASIEEFVQLDHLRPYYRLGSHSIHGGARGFELGRTRNGFTAGATVFGNQSELIHLTGISLLQVTANLHLQYQKASEQVSFESTVGLQVMRELVTRLGDAVRAAHVTATRRDWIE